MDRAVINADFVLWAAPLKMGFPSELLKRAMDKHLPLIHPYMVVDQSEAHHLKRYTHYPRVGLLIEKEADTDERDLQIITDIYCRTAINFKTRLEFCADNRNLCFRVARLIWRNRRGLVPLPGHLPATTGVTIQPPARLTLFNGSPRGKRGNTPIFLHQIAEGFGGPIETFHLIRLKETDRNGAGVLQRQNVFSSAFRLYTDSMPGMTKHFIEALRPLVGGVSTRR